MTTPERIWATPPSDMFYEDQLWFGDPDDANTEYVRIDLHNSAKKAAFEEGFLAGRGDGWVNNPKIEVAWKESRSKGEMLCYKSN